TIPKTYTANTFTNLQTFANSSTTLASFAYASSTKWFGGGLSSNCDSGNVLTWTNGVFGCAADQTGGSSFAYLFPSNATSTLLNFNGGLTAFASSTIGNGTQTGGLTINGGATTTGNAYFANKVGIGTTTPWGLLSIQSTSDEPLFVSGQG